MIDCNVTVDKKPDPKGDRVLLTFEYVSPLSVLTLYIFTHLSYAVASSSSMRSGNLSSDSNRIL